MDLECLTSCVLEPTSTMHVLVTVSCSANFSFLPYRASWGNSRHNFGHQAWSQMLIPVWQSRREQPSSIVSWPPIKQRHDVLASPLSEIPSTENGQMKEASPEWQLTNSTMIQWGAADLQFEVLLSQASCDQGSCTTSDLLSMACGLFEPPKGARMSGPTTTPNPALPSFSLTWQSASKHVPAATLRTQSLIPVGRLCCVPIPQRIKFCSSTHPEDPPGCSSLISRLWSPKVGT